MFYLELLFTLTNQRIPLIKIYYTIYNPVNIGRDAMTARATSRHLGTPGQEVLKIVKFGLHWNSYPMPSLRLETRVKTYDFITCIFENSNPGVYIYMHNWYTCTYYNTHTTYYSGPSLTRPPYLPRNCGHIIEVAFGEGGEVPVNTLMIVVEEKIHGLIREGGLCWEWPLR